jgi:hypothetical protein
VSDFPLLCTPIREHLVAHTDRLVSPVRVDVFVVMQPLGADSAADLTWRELANIHFRPNRKHDISEANTQAQTQLVAAADTVRY